MKSFNIYSKLFFILLLLLAMTLPGCAFKDVDKRTFVVGIGIDPVENSDNKYKVTLKIAKPIGTIKDATAPTYAYMSHESDSISAAIRIMETHTDKVIEFSHTKFIAISEKLLDGNLKDFLDYFVRRGDIQLVAWIAAAKPSAEHILKLEPTTESAGYVALFNFFDGNGTESPYIVTTFLYEFRRQILAKGTDSVLPLIESNKEDTELIINKSVIIKQKHKSLELSPTHTKFYNSLIKHANGYSYKVHDEDLKLLLNVNKFKMKFKMITDKGKPPRVDMKVKIIASVLESSESLSTLKLNEYNKLTVKYMEKITLELLELVQKNELDPMGFGLRYRATRLNDKDTYSKWESMYPDLEFNVKYDVDIQSIGAVQ
ncbi:Ger(x)C family spore germination protein [Sporosarcina sp. FA9]|uniref:Ger(x)C family spore germination protein n=1 Tax=Sporosarcina sp. FA9 TaxID=3413030 RepID=UPI003F658830